MQAMFMLESIYLNFRAMRSVLLIYYIYSKKLKRYKY